MNRVVLVFLVVFLVFSPAIAEEAREIKPKDSTLRNSLSIGQVAPDFTLPNSHGKKVSLYKKLEKGPVVLSFYRGVWCPVCNEQLTGLQQALSEITKLDGQLIAVSPQTPSHSLATQLKNRLTFEVLSDQGNQLAKQYGIVWEVPAGDQEGFSQWLLESQRKQLEDFNKQPGFELPVPATFVIGADKKVVFAFKDVDYKTRARVSDILVVLEELKN